MDPTSALTGKTQISVHCSQCNFTITKWVNQVKNVDSSVTHFKDELLALQLTFDRLSSSLKDGAMIEAARITDQYAGSNLWSQISTTLGDCQTTILSLKQALENIEYGSRRVSSMLKHLAEALSTGDLVLMRDTVKLLDQNIAFPITMINISILLQRPDLKQQSAKFMLRELAGLKGDHDSFVSRVRTVMLSSRSSDTRTLIHMQEFGGVMDMFLANTASLLNHSWSGSVRSRLINSNPLKIPYQSEQEIEIPMLEDSATIHTIETYEELEAPAETIRSSSCTPTPEEQTQHNEYDSENDNEIELELTLEYMANGQADLEIDDYAGAEENFRRALEMAEENDFSTRLAYGPGEILLMLADCLMKQEKEEEALELLEPIADGIAAVAKNDDTASRTGTIKDSPELSLQYKANHILGVVFLKRLDYHAAEKRAKQAFKGRRRLLGPHDPMTLESVQLIIDIYTAKDDKINARAYKRFLEPPPKSTSRQSAPSVKSQNSVISPRILPAKAPPLPTPQKTVGANSTVASPSIANNITESFLPSRASTIARSSSTPPVPLPVNKIPQSPRSSPASATQTPITLPVNDVDTSQPQSPPSNTSQTTRPTVPANSQVTTHVSLPESNRDSTTFSTQGRLGNIAEESFSIVSPIELKPPMEIKLPIQSSTDSNPSPDMHTDPLPPNVGPATANTRRKMNWANAFKPVTTKPDLNVFQRLEKFYPETSAREATSRNSSMTGLNLLMDAKRQMSLASNLFDTRSLISKMTDYGDELSGRASISGRSYSTSTHPPARTRQELAPRFQAIMSLRQEGKKSAAIDTGMKLLREYDPDRKVLMVREAELKKNMKESHKGLSGTGHGYAPIHFFCERKVEANIEVELLIEGGVDVNAVACKAGMPGTDPFTPLQRAVELGHVDIVRLLVAANVVIGPPQTPKEAVHNLGNKDALSHPLMIAVQKGETQITWLLLVAGAAKIIKDFPQRQWHGSSLLHEACWHANNDMVKMLLDYSKVLKAQGDSKQQQEQDEVSVIGLPGQQDQFGATPIMYAIDVRDCTSYKARAHKIKQRKDCLKMLLEHDVHGDLNTQAYRDSVARTLSLKWTRGPGNGHSIFCYADEAGDEELIRILDPFRYQVSPGLRCGASPQCSASLRTESVQVGTVGGGKDGRQQTVRLPSFPELMSEPLMFPGETHAHSNSYARVHEVEAPPPSFEVAVAPAPVSPTVRDGTLSAGSDLGTTLST